MFKIRILLIAAVFILMVSHTVFLWEDRIGLLILLPGFTFILACLYVIIGLIQHIWQLIKERLHDKRHLYQTGLLVLILSATFFIPDFFAFSERSMGNDVLVASHVGGGNCSTVISLKDSKKFTFNTFCLAAQWSEGTYEIKHDTILLHFEGDEKLKGSYGIIKLNQYQAHIRKQGAILYLSMSGRVTIPYEVTLNNLFK